MLCTFTICRKFWLSKSCTIMMKQLHNDATVQHAWPSYAIGSVLRYKLRGAKHLFDLLFFRSGGDYVSNMFSTSVFFFAVHTYWRDIFQLVFVFALFWYMSLYRNMVDSAFVFCYIRWSCRVICLCFRSWCSIVLFKAISYWAHQGTRLWQQSAYRTGACVFQVIF